MSWWGDDARTETYQQAIQAFEAKLQYITVETIYGTTAGEDQTADVMQVDWTWPGQNADQFVDLNEYSDVIDLEQFSQQHIDAILNSGSSKTYEQLPKGIQDQTLETVHNFLERNPDTDFTGEEIADKVGLSRVTVRRYLNFLLEKGTISGNMNYETGGRPCMLYRINK